jgi:titin
LLAAPGSAGTIDLSWSDNAGDETGYIVFRSTDNVNFTREATVGANVTIYFDTGLATGTTYYYKVEAYRADGYSDFSAVASTVAP